MPFALLPALLLALQPVPPPGEDQLGRTIVEVRVTSSEAERVPGLDALVGTPLTRALVRSLIESIYLTDRFRDVRVGAESLPDGVRLRIDLEERTRLRSLDATGNDHLETRELRRVAGFVTDAEAHPEALAEMRGRIEAAYAERGYPNAAVEFSLGDPDPDGRQVLTVVVDEGPPVRIAAIRFDGDPVLDERQIRAAFGVQAGDTWDQARVAEARERLLRFYQQNDRLLAQVAPPEVSPREDGQVDLRITVTAGLPVRIVFGGQRSLSAAALMAASGMDEGFGFTPEELEEACERLEDHYRRQGFPEATVDWSTGEARVDTPPPTTPFDDPASWSAGVATGDPFAPLGRLPEDGGAREPQPVLQLRFRVREGPRLRVARMVFEGNAFREAEALESEVRALVGATEVPAAPDLAVPTGGEAPLLPWDLDQVYLPERYADAALRLEETYRSEGFLSARVTLLEPARDPGAGTLTPAFRIEEGPRSMLRSVKVRGNAAIETAELLEAFLLEVDDPVNELKVEQSRQALIDLYASRGHLYAAVTREVAFSADRSLADLVFAVEEGPEVRVRAIEVTGNAETATGLILDSLPFAEGDVFSPEAADAGEQRLLRVGVFRSVTVGVADPERVEAEKVVRVQVIEYPPQSLELRAGFSTAEGARAAFGYGYRNLFGYAVGFHLRLRLNYQLFFLGNDTYERAFDDLPLQDQLERLVSAGLSIPYLPGLGSLLATQLDLANERDNEPFYGLDRSSAFLGLSTGWRKLLSFSLRGGVEYNDVVRFGGDYAVCTGDERPGVVCIRPEDARRLRTPQGVSTFAVIRAGATVDWRDDPFNPSRGLYATASAEWVRSFEPVFDAAEGVSSFSHLIKTAFQLSGYAPLGAGLVLALSARYGQIFQLQDESRTFPDRYFYLGGYDTIRGFPQESVSVADAPAGLPSPGGDLFLALRGEIRIPLTEAFGAAVFADSGNVWRDPSAVDLAQLRYAVGAGLRLQTPVGPLSLDFGVNLAPRADWAEDFGALHFSIGTF